MTTSDTNVNNLILNTLTKNQYEGIQDPSSTELFFVTDERFISTEECVQIYPVIETYSNGASWYRIYGDGWCEQGGEASWSGNPTLTIILLKQYANTNYNLFTNCFGTAQEQYPNAIAISDKTVSTFELKPYTNNRTANWQASGYLAEGEY